jgi:hypothetical protein
MNTKNFALLALLGLSSVACTNDSAADLIGFEPIPEQVSYAMDVKSIIDNNCTNCHGVSPVSGSNLSLTTYGEVRNAVLNNGLINRLNLPEGNSLLMPQGGPKLPQTVINLVEKWEQDGLNP